MTPPQSPPAPPDEPAARTPVDEEELRVGAPGTSAAGIPAVVSSLRHAVREMGALRSAKLLLTVNQRAGFDCQSCAWPNPEDRHVAEFCENGAKAVADEGTRRKIGG